MIGARCTIAVQRAGPGDRQVSTHVKLLCFEASYLIGLGALGSLDDVELDFIAFFEALVAVALDGTVVDEDVGARRRDRGNRSLLRC